MGGQAFCHLPSIGIRMPAEMYAAAVAQACRAVQGIPGVVACEATRHLRHKTDFGDVDLIIAVAPAEEQPHVSATLPAALGAVARTGDMYAVPLAAMGGAPARLVQVDTHVVTPAAFQHHLAFSSYSCFAALVNVALLPEGLVFSKAGLELPFFPNDDHITGQEGVASVNAHCRPRHLLSSNFNAIATFLHLDPTTFWAGFQTAPALLAFLCQSPYIHPAAIMCNQARSKHKRIITPELIAAVRLLVAERGQREPVYHPGRSGVREAALSYFDAHAAVGLGIAALCHAAQQHEHAHTHLNGHLVHQWTGLAPGPVMRVVLKEALAALVLSSGLEGNAAVCAASDGAIKAAVMAAAAAVMPKGV